MIAGTVCHRIKAETTVFKDVAVAVNNGAQEAIHGRSRL